jgi:hypothetical protein
MSNAEKIANARVYHEASGLEGFKRRNFAAKNAKGAKYMIKTRGLTRAKTQRRKGKKNDSELGVLATWREKISAAQIADVAQRNPGTSHNKFTLRPWEN